jgi:hypothetical protein
LAPDGRRYAVKVVRVLWPGTGSQVVDGASNIADGASNFLPLGTGVDLVADAVSLLNNRGVWSVRVFRESVRYGLPPLVYGEEWRDASNAVHRAHEIAEGLAAGKKP